MSQTIFAAMFGVRTLGLRLLSVNQPLYPEVQTNWQPTRASEAQTLNSETSHPIS